MKQVNRCFILSFVLICFSIISRAQQLDITVITSDYNGYNVSCYESKDGWITCNPTGGTPPYTYRWSTESTNQTIIGLSATYYAVAVTDAANSVFDFGINLTGPDQIKISHSYTNSNCYHCFNGAISISPEGGVIPYSYLWNDGPNYQNRSGLGGGSFEVLVTDANGCANSSEIFSITEPGRDNWALAGDSGSNPSTQFLGTIDSTDLVLRTHNIQRFRIAGNGSITIPGMAASASRMMIVNSAGTLSAGDIFVSSPPPSICNTFPFTSPIQVTSIVGPYGGSDVFNCNQRFGFGTTAPQERIHILGNCRFSSATNTTGSDYLNIGRDGNSNINSYGAGELRINYDSPQNVRICTNQTTRGDVEIGGNTYLSTLSGKVGIGTTSPALTLDVRHTDATGGIALTNGASGANVHSEIRFLKNSTVKWSLGNDLAANGTQDFFIWDNANSATRFYIDNSGKVGLGTTAPSLSLEVQHTDATGGMALTNIASGSNVHSEIRFLKNFTVKWSIGNDLATNGSQNFFIWDHANSSTRFFIDNSGKVGIGTTSPSRKLEIAHSESQGGLSINQLSSSSSQSRISFQKAGTETWAIGTDINYNNGNNFFIYGGSTPSTKIYIDPDGKVGIGTIPPVQNMTNGIYKLYVESGIATRDVKVTNGNFPDFVYAKDYKLMSVYDLEKYISINKHLPEIPSADDIANNNGFELGEMQTKLLMKIEEQSLYIISLQKQIDEMKNKLDHFVKN